MSTRTPPGWYPDPGHTGFGPAPERWWDGGTWTEHTRTAPAAPPPGFPQQPGVPPYGPAPRKPKGPLVAGIVASVAVVLALVVGVLVVTGGGPGENRADDRPTPGASAGSTPPDGDSGAGDAPGDETSPSPGPRRLAIAHGVTLPLLKGWERVPGTYGAAVHTTSYTCPLKRERCVRAGASVYVTPADGDPEAVAKADIEANAARSYGEDYYGGITSHRQTASEPVRVAGQDGYLVRWKIDNKADPDAYVQSVAFPHPDGTGQMLVLRIGVDIHEDAPPVDALEKITAGVKRGAVLDDSESEAI